MKILFTLLFLAGSQVDNNQESPSVVGISIEQVRPHLNKRMLYKMWKCMIDHNKDIVVSWEFPDEYIDDLHKQESKKQQAEPTSFVEMFDLDDYSLEKECP